MPNPIDPHAWSTPRGPWPDATDLDRIFDYGSPWCINADGHPHYEPDDDYPDRDKHFPPFECRTTGLSVDAYDGLSGPRCELHIYAAKPYRFGELRHAAAPEHTRILFDLYTDDDHTSPRFSISLGDALRIARALFAAVETVDDCPRSRT